jgi:hypothetical protein
VIEDVRGLARVELMKIAYCALDESVITTRRKRTHVDAKAAISKHCAGE